MKEAMVIVTVFVLILVIVPLVQGILDYVLLQHAREMLLATTEIAVYNLMTKLDTVAFSEARLAFDALVDQIASELRRTQPELALETLEADMEGDRITVRYRQPMRRLLGQQDTWMKVERTIVCRWGCISTSVLD